MPLGLAVVRRRHGRRWARAQDACVSAAARERQVQRPQLRADVRHVHDAAAFRAATGQDPRDWSGLQHALRR
eukprot:7275483-Prymnesium_polylepis.1